MTGDRDFHYQQCTLPSTGKPYVQHTAGFTLYKQPQIDWMWIFVSLWASKNKQHIFDHGAEANQWRQNKKCFTFWIFIITYLDALRTMSTSVSAGRRPQCAGSGKCQVSFIRTSIPLSPLSVCVCLCGITLSEAIVSFWAKRTSASNHD